MTSSSKKTIPKAPKAKPAANANISDLEQLRALLLADDRLQAELRENTFKQRIDETVSKDEFLDRLSETLAEALRRAERDNPKAVARALSPAVVKSIRREIMNSRDDMVEALYPITGRMVRASVRDAIAGLMRDINNKLDAATSPSVIKAHAKSLIARKPASTYLLADTVDTLQLSRAILIDRENGSTIHAWYAGDNEQADSDDTALVSSMFAAISSFASERLTKKDSELRTLDLNGTQVALRHGAKHLLAVEYAGELSGDVSNHIDQAFEQMLEARDDEAQLSAIPILQWAEPTAQSTSKRKLAKPVLTLIAACLIGLIGWTVWDRVWFAGHLKKLTTQIEAQAPLHAPLITGNRAQRLIVVRGLVPASFDVQAISAQLAQVGIEVENQTQAVAGSNDVNQLAAQLQSGLQEQQSTTAAQLDALSSALRGTSGELTGKLNTTIESFSQEIERLSEQVQNVQTLSMQQGRQLDALERSTQLALSAITQERTEQQNDNALRFTDMQSRFESLRQALNEMAKSDAETADTITTLNQNIIETKTGFRDFSDQLLAAARQDIETIAVKFEQGNNPLDAGLAAAQLARAASAINLFSLSVTISGHSDEVGTVQTNERISRDRAQWVANQLRALGVAPEALSIVAQGTQPDPDGTIARQVRLRVTASGN